MPDEIYGVMAVKNGQKQTIMNLSNARQKSYADLQNMTDAQKKGVIVCPDYPKEEFLVTADEVSYGGGTVKDALDKVTYTQVFSIDINGTTDGSGNINTGIDKRSFPPIGSAMFDPDSTSYDGLYVPFISPATNRLYFHVTSFAGTAQVGVTVKGKAHIVRRL